MHRIGDNLVYALANRLSPKYMHAYQRKIITNPGMTEIMVTHSGVE